MDSLLWWRKGHHLFNSYKWVWPSEYILELLLLLVCSVYPWLSRPLLLVVSMLYWGSLDNEVFDLLTWIRLYVKHSYSSIFTSKIAKCLGNHFQAGKSILPVKCHKLAFYLWAQGRLNEVPKVPLYLNLTCSLFAVSTHIIWSWHFPYGWYI